MAKSKFENMSTNEWLGDPTTQFMKTGETFRAISEDQIKLGQAIPRFGNGIKVEYDISFSIGEYKIKGYKFTDFMSKCVMLMPQHDVISRQIISEVAGWGPTDEGRRIVDELRKSITDKYITSGDEDLRKYYCKELIAMPGTNVLMKDDMVDWLKIDDLVANGAKVKLHPVTSKVWRTMMGRRWKDAVIPGDAPLYDIMRKADKVYFTMASETGIAATLLGKQVGLVSGKKTWSNFEHIYRGIDQCKEKMKLIDKMTALFSHPESGIITTLSKDINGDIAKYFEYTKKFPHERD
jgi:hypothetical protein